MKTIAFRPIDTWFFRDGTPFFPRAGAQAHPGGLFPPHPPTTCGAIRSWLARANGWDQPGLWPSRLNEVLGSGPVKLGTLSLAGPFLLQGGEPLFPAPRHIVGKLDVPSGEMKRRWISTALRRPGSGVLCDLGDNVPLPDITADVKDPKGADGLWVTRAGLEAILRGELPDGHSVVAKDALWCDELRIGLERNNETRTAEEGMLYAARHVRPKDDVGLGVAMVGVPRDWKIPFGGSVPFGGEGRLAAVDEGPGLSIKAPLDEVKRYGEAAIVALTPLDIDWEVVRGTKPLTAKDGAVRVVAACVGRAIRVGGFNDIAHQPMSLESLVPAGSVLFVRGEDPSMFGKWLDELVGKDEGMPWVGRRHQMGFGRIAVGVWPKEKKEEKR